MLPGPGLTKLELHVPGRQVPVPRAEAAGRHLLGDVGQETPPEPTFDVKSTGGGTFV